MNHLTKDQFAMLKKYSYHANSLYNCCIYTAKCFYKETGRYIGLKQLYHAIKSHFHYNTLPSFIAQQIIRLVDKNFRSYFALLRKKLKGQYEGEVNPPGYRKPKSYFNLIFDNTRIIHRPEKQELKLFKNLKLRFNHQIGPIKQGVIKWNGHSFVLYITYQETCDDVKSNNKRYLSIDLGLNNLAACFSNVGIAFIINGKPLKSYNNNYNKRKAKIQSEIKIKNKKDWCKRLSVLNENRANFVGNYLNQAVAVVVKQAQKHGINTIVCGYNQSWKDGINIGKKNNKDFCDIPHASFVLKLESKCAKEGINFVLQEEDYTSKCSFVDSEPVEKRDVFVGNRAKRGLFITKDRIQVNADINGAANILRKVVPNLVFDKERDMGGIVTPVVFNLLNPLSVS